MSNALILDSLEVNNFRAFRHLQIDRLGKVNLIVGKNNVGKTCLLEALRIYASRGSLQTMREILRERNEYDATDAVAEKPILVLKYLFHGWEDFDESTDTAFVIGPNNNTYYLYVRIATLYNRYFDKLSSQQFGPDSFIKVFEELAINGYTNQVPLALGVRIQDSPNANKVDQILILLTKYEQQMRVFNNALQEVRNFYPTEPVPSQFVSTQGLSPEEVADLWDGIYLTDLEDDVVEALQLIEPTIKSVGLVPSAQDKSLRVPQARIPGPVNRILLSSLGEGMNRLFSLTLALVNAQNGFLLIDEVGNGIHYSIQPKLWRFIFEVAERLNVQVFATTHSWDSVTAFQQAAQEHDTEGLLISLRPKEGRPGEVVGTLFDEADLEVVAAEQIEVR